ncbi:hypothetical protein [Desulfogranum japonicum]|uniref:hypothetical protein n=1 Tax=Desulfogranum japonicum TaxID=231447 RepID=UPI0004241500|nr:hypothetical protein [Desulfogranum japonicum]
MAWNFFLLDLAGGGSNWLVKFFNGLSGFISRWAPLFFICMKSTEMKLSVGTVSNSAPGERSIEQKNNRLPEETVVFCSSLFRFPLQ